MTTKRKEIKNIKKRMRWLESRVMELEKHPALKWRYYYGGREISPDEYYRRRYENEVKGIWQLNDTRSS